MTTFAKIKIILLSTFALILLNGVAAKAQNTDNAQTTLSSSQKANASILKVEHFTLEDGLSHRDVRGICQDERGLMWFATAYGVNRFDGYEFKWFTVEKNGLTTNNTQHIHLGPKGNIWVFSGLENDRIIDIIDPITESVRSFREVFGEEAQFLSENISFTAGPDGQFAFLMPGRIVIYDGRFTKIMLPSEKDIESGKVLFGKDELWLWVESYGGKRNRLLKVNNKGVEQEHVFPESTFTDLYEVKTDGSIRLLDFHYDESNDKNYQRYHRISPSGVMVKDAAAEELFRSDEVHIVYLRNFIRKIKSDYWVNSYNQGFWIIPSDPLGTSILLSETYPELRTANFAFEDKKETVWVSTEFGVFSLQFKENQFRNFFSQRDEVKGLPMRGLQATGSENEKALWGIVENRGELWNVDMAISKETLAKSNDGASRWALDKTKDDELLFVSKKGIIQMDAYTGKTNKIYPHDFLDVTTSTWKIHLDKYDQLWFDRADDGMLFVNNQGELDILREWTGSVGYAFLYQFIETETDTAWLVSNKGLFRLDIKNKQVVERFWREGQGRNHLPYDNVHHIWMESDYFWLATANNGLVKWHPDRGVIQRYTRADGLSNNTLYAAYPDDYGNIWLPSDYGINVLEESTGKVRTYTTQDGICHNEFNRLSHTRDKEGYFYFGTLDGVTAFHPKDFVADTTQFQAPMVITGFQQFDGDEGKLVDKTAELIQTNSITLQPNDPLIRLSFALLSYEQLENVQYAYNIEGVDENWTYQKENTLRLGRLPYGKHLLRIKGQAANGQWSAEELQIHVVSLRPFYLQTWFFITVLLLLVGAFFLLSRYREKSLREQRTRLEHTVKERTATIEQQKEELLQLDSAKTRFFANVSHELRTPISLIRGPIKTLLKRKPPDDDDIQLLQLANQGSKNLQLLVSEILDLGKLESGKMEVSNTPVRLAAYFTHYLSQFESLAYQKGVAYGFDVFLAKKVVVQLDKEKCRQLIYNLLSNAFKFTQTGGKVHVTVKMQDGQLHIEVSDTGKGIHPNDLSNVFNRYFQTNRPDAPATGGTGIGLALCQEYARLFGGQISVESKLGEGTVFQVAFPVELATEDVLEEDLAQDLTPAFRNVKEKPDQFLLLKNTPSPHAQQVKKPTVLVVEDNKELQSYIQLVLKKQFNVAMSGNGHEALAYLAENSHPDLIISDLMMPIMDGYQLLERLKGQAATQHIPVIMLTARAAKDDRLKALRIGVDDYLTKPFDEEELIVRINNLLANRTVRMEASAEEEVRNSPVAIGLAMQDKEWLDAFETYLQSNLSHNYLSVPVMADEFAMSTSTLQRQTKRLTGLSPQKYLLEMRLNKARQLLEERRYQSVSRVALEVGYGDVRNFSRSFKKRYGKSPSDLVA